MIIAFLLPEWANGVNFLLAVFGLGVTLLSAWLLISARRSTDISTLQVDRATAAEALLKIRENELTALHTLHTETEEELEAVTAEHRTLSGIKVQELMAFWADREQILAEVEDYKREIRILKKRKDGDT